MATLTEKPTNKQKKQSSRIPFPQRPRDDSERMFKVMQKVSSELLKRRRKHGMMFTEAEIEMHKSSREFQEGFIEGFRWVADLEYRIDNDRGRSEKDKAEIKALGGIVDNQHHLECFAETRKRVLAMTDEEYKAWVTERAVSGYLENYF